MRFNDQKKFHRYPKLLEEMLELRKNGWPLKVLAKKYNMHHTSILYQCQKYKVKPGAKTKIKIKFKTLPNCLICGKKVKFEYYKYCSRSCYLKAHKKIEEIKVAPKIINGEKINLGKNYLEYVKEEELKKLKKKFKSENLAELFATANFSNFKKKGRVKDN